MSVTAGGYRPGLTLPPAWPDVGGGAAHGGFPHYYRDLTRLVAMASSYADSVRCTVERPMPRCLAIAVTDLALPAVQQ